MTIALAFLGLQDEIRLEFKFVKGTTTRYQTIQETTMEMEPEVKARTRVEITQSKKVQDVSGAVASVAVTTERIKFSLKGTMERQFDSEKDDLAAAREDPMLKPFAALLGHPIAMKVKPTGEVLEIDSKELEDAVKNPAMTKQILDQMRDFAKMPEEPVKIGSSWKTSRAMNMGPVRMDILVTSTLKEAKSGVAKIDLDMQFKLGGEGSGLKMDIKDQDSKGTMEFDLATGDIRRSEITQNFTVEIQAGDEARRMKVSQKVSYAQVP